jgi:hypothetical protein
MSSEKSEVARNRLNLSQESIGVVDYNGKLLSESYLFEKIEGLLLQLDLLIRSSETIGLGLPLGIRSYGKDLETMALVMLRSKEPLKPSKIKLFESRVYIIDRSLPKHSLDIEIEGMELLTNSNEATVNKEPLLDLTQEEYTLIKRLQTILKYFHFAKKIKHLSQKSHRFNLIPVPVLEELMILLTKAAQLLGVDCKHLIEIAYLGTQDFAQHILQDKALTSQLLTSLAEHDFQTLLSSMNVKYDQLITVTSEQKTSLSLSSKSALYYMFSPFAMQKKSLYVRQIDASINLLWPDRYTN